MRNNFKEKYENNKNEEREPGKFNTHKAISAKRNSE